jgi:hypothetical protein
MVASSAAIGLKYEIVGDQNPDWESRPDGDGRLDV